MSSKILLIGDPHFKKDNKVQTDFMVDNVISFINSRTDEIDGVVVLGDILHRHDKIDLFPLKNAMEFLSSVRKVLKPDAKLWVIIGNHDRPNNKNFLTDEHPFNSLKLWSNTKVIDNVYVDNVKGMNFMFAPYVEPGRLFEALNLEYGITESNIGSSDIMALFCHQEFKGCNFGIGGKSEVGDEYPKDGPLCISGHIHGSQWVGKNVFYTGIPYEQHWITNTVTGPKESRFQVFKPRGIFVLTSDLATKSNSIKRLHLQNSPINLSLHYKSGRLFNTIIESCDKVSIKDVIYQSLSNDDLKIIETIKLLKIKIKISLQKGEEPASIKPIKDQFTSEGVHVIIDDVKVDDMVYELKRLFSHDFLGDNTTSKEQFFKDSVFKHLKSNDYSDEVEKLIKENIFG